MQSPLIAVVLCILAQAAAAQSVTPAAAPKEQPRPVAAQAAPATPVPVHAAQASVTPAPQQPTQAAAPARAGGELIKTAAAGTRDDLPPAMSRDTSARAAQDEEHPRRGGTAMLLAALALMSGIALRRFGGPRG